MTSIAVAVSGKKPSKIPIHQKNNGGILHFVKQRGGSECVSQQILNQAKAFFLGPLRDEAQKDMRAGQGIGNRVMVIQRYAKMLAYMAETAGGYGQMDA